MYHVMKEIKIEMAHRLQAHSSKCRYIHGHSWKMLIKLGAPALSGGMVMDFAHLKNVLEEVVGFLDHSLLLQDSDPLCEIFYKWEEVGSSLPGMRLYAISAPPTSESLAEYIWQEVWRKLGSVPERALMTVVQETKTSTAFCDAPPNRAVKLELKHVCG